MSEYVREIAKEPPRCGCCDRLLSVCMEDPCDEVRDSTSNEGKP